MFTLYNTVMTWKNAYRQMILSSCYTAVWLDNHVCLQNHNVLIWAY